MDARLSRKEEQQRVRAVLDVLDPVDRAAVIMYYWYDFSYQEICEALSLTNSAVKSRLHRARRAMAQNWLEREAEQAASIRQPDTLLAERMTP
jgi:RNA polymerase sigma-70 factor (ECF subfamily)